MTPVPLPTPTRSVRRAVALALGALAPALLPASSGAQGGQGASAQAAAENDYYRLVTVPLPEGVVLEVGGLTTLPDGRLGVATRRGEIWLIENATMEGSGRPHFARFAHGLHEPLGLAWRDGALYAAQRGELTRLRDTDGDGTADRYETVYAWPLSGNYHEYSFGPVFDARGNMIVTLNLAWVGKGASFVPWRGWTLEIAPDGRMTPIATGMRSPAAFGHNLEGDLFYSENQGDWVGSGFLAHVAKGDFTGNPEGLRWTGLPGSPLTLRLEDVPSTGEPKHEVAKRVPGLKVPAVWFPHTVMGISTSGILVDSTRGAFGPFGGQLFVGDQGQSKVMRVFLEKVDGVWQGAAFPFREGFMSGVLRQAWAHDGSMFVGMTSRGWGSTGRAPYGLQRLVWTGKTPFEPLSIEARPDGFEIAFTEPVDRTAAAAPGAYAVSGFTYKYHATYGSPVVDQQAHPVRHVVVSEDGRRARLVVDGLRAGFVHEIKMPGVRSSSGGRLLHEVGYYTLNRIPGGERLAVPVAAAAAATPAAAPARSDSASAPAPAASSTSAARPGRPVATSPKRLTTPPSGWRGGLDTTITVSTAPGLRFDPAQFRVKPGARVKLVLVNGDDMLHNLVVTRPAKLEEVNQASLQLGLKGESQNYVPVTPDVLVHTRILEPAQSDAIYFQAPSAPGEYPFLCTFPGHGFTMRGVMHVVR